MKRNHPAQKKPRHHTGVLGHRLRAAGGTDGRPPGGGGLLECTPKRWGRQAAAVQPAGHETQILFLQTLTIFNPKLDEKP